MFICVSKQNLDRFNEARFKGESIFFRGPLLCEHLLLVINIKWSLLARTLRALLSVYCPSFGRLRFMIPFCCCVFRISVPRYSSVRMLISFLSFSFFLISVATRFRSLLLFSGDHHIFLCVCLLLLQLLLFLYVVCVNASK